MQNAKCKVQNFGVRFAHGFIHSFMNEFIYNLAKLPQNFTKELFIPEHAAYTLKITGDVSHNVSYAFTARVAKNASLTVEDFVRTTANCTSRLMVLLEGAGAAVKDISRYHGSESARFDIERVVVHTGEQTVSHLEARGVGEDTAHAVWRGRVHVAASARKCQAFQRYDALLAGEKPFVDASPVLEIHTNDVQCSHSASVQRIKPEHMFYMGSRGIVEEKARRMLIEGFLGKEIGDRK